MTSVYYWDEKPGLPVKLVGHAEQMVRMCKTFCLLKVLSETSSDNGNNTSTTSIATRS